MLFYTESPLKFAFSKDISEFNNDSFKFEANTPQFGILGVPFDSTSTYKPGARFGPNMVREASYNLERYNLHFKKNLEATFYEMGNLEVVHGNFNQTSKHLESTIKEIKDNLIPITIGGEHTITYSVIKGLNKVNDIQDTTIIHFDAHMDLREEYMGEKYSHATVMRRITDLNPKDIIQIGVRSCLKDEESFAREEGIKYYTSTEVKSNINEIEKVISNINNPIYVTVDIDVLDPAYAPSVGTPTPLGLDPYELQRLIYNLQGKNII